MIWLVVVFLLGNLITLLQLIVLMRRLFDWLNISDRRDLTEPWPRQLRQEEPPAT